MLTGTMLLALQLEDELKKKYSAELVKEKHKYDSELAKIELSKQELVKQQESLLEQVEKATRERVATEKIKLETKLREQISYEQSEVITSLQSELSQKSQQVQELNKSKAEIEV